MIHIATNYSSENGPVKSVDYEIQDSGDLQEHKVILIWENDVNYNIIGRHKPVVSYTDFNAIPDLNAYVMSVVNP